MFLIIISRRTSCELSSSFYATRPDHPKQTDRQTNASLHVSACAPGSCMGFQYTSNHVDAIRSCRGRSLCFRYCCCCCANVVMSLCRSCCRYCRSVIVVVLIIVTVVAVAVIAVVLVVVIAAVVIVVTRVMHLNDLEDVFIVVVEVQVVETISFHGLKVHLVS